MPNLNKFLGSVQVFRSFFRTTDSRTIKMFRKMEQKLNRTLTSYCHCTCTLFCCHTLELLFHLIKWWITATLPFLSTRSYEKYNTRVSWRKDQLISHDNKTNPHVSPCPRCRPLRTRSEETEEKREQTNEIQMPKSSTSMSDDYMVTHYTGLTGDQSQMRS